MSQVSVVAVPYIRYDYHAQFMVETIRSLYANKSDHPLHSIAVVNSFNADRGYLDWIHGNFSEVHFNDRNNLARAWNVGIRRALERNSDYILIINLDLLFHPEFVNNLLSFAQEHREAIIWSGIDWNDSKTLEQAPLEGELSGSVNSACFLIDRRLTERVGEFDEVFEPAYLEDRDMLYRVKLAGEKVLATPKARFHHIKKITIQGAFANLDRDLLKSLDDSLKANDQRYILKWGGAPDQERYTSPYGKKN